ncbi:MAG: site-specific integrase [bacterium]
MTKTTYQNEQLKKKFFTYLRGGKGFEESSVRSSAEAIWQWQLFAEGDDFTNYDQEKAQAFRQWLATRPAKTRAGHLSLATQSNYLRRVKGFFLWLSDQPGFRSKVLKGDIEFLRLSNKEALIVRSGTTRPMPTLEEAQKIIESIVIKDEIDLRDRALLSFALATGCRISAIISLKVKSFDKVKQTVYQNPADGVHTKNTKPILGTFFSIGWGAPEQYFMEWFERLEARGAGQDDPIFPATRGEIGRVKSADGGVLVGNLFWKNAAGARKVFQKRCKEAGSQYFNPHSFRHFVISVMSRKPLTEEQKKAVSRTLGHANVGTTFRGAYGNANMSDETAVNIVKRIKEFEAIKGAGGSAFTSEEMALLEGLMTKMQAVGIHIPTVSPD